jgi:hypothetical protein
MRLENMAIHTAGVVEVKVLGEEVGRCAAAIDLPVCRSTASSRISMRVNSSGRLVDSSRQIIGFVSILCVLFRLRKAVALC